jgi:hypothetical protein
MKHNTYPTSSLALLAVAATGCVAVGIRKDSYNPQIDATNFQTTIDNPYNPLVPGTVYRLIETVNGKSSDNVITVTHDTKTIMGVRCVVVHDTVSEKGVLVEDTLDWYAQHKDGTVWYFGEDTKEYKPNGKVVTEGSWEGGVDGAQPGIMMPAEPKPGAPYRQEYKFREAEDMGQVVTVGETVTVPAGTYSDCVKTKEWSLLESGYANKWYCKGVGVVKSLATDGELATLQSVKSE